jgi:hypothetical protein
VTKKRQVFKKAIAALIILILFVPGSIAAPFEQWNKTFGGKGHLWSNIYYRDFTHCIFI